MGYFGRSQDPILTQTQALDAQGNSVDNRTVIIRAVPVDPSSRRPGKPYPPVGTGSTDARGMIDAKINLARIAGNPAFENASNAVTLQAYYYDSSLGLRLGATVDEYLSATNDPIVLPPTPGHTGATEPSADVVLQAEPMSSGTSTPNAAPTAPLDLSKVNATSQDVTPAGVLNLGVFARNSSGALTYQGAATEYVGAQPNFALPPPIVDATQKAWGDGEDFGCLASFSYGYGDPNYANSGRAGNGTCEYAPGQGANPVTPMVDSAASGGTASAVTVNLGWRSLEDKADQPDNYYPLPPKPTPADRLNAEVAAIVGHSGNGLVLLPSMQAEGPDCSALCNDAAHIQTVNNGSPSAGDSQYTLQAPNSPAPAPGAMVDASGGGNAQTGTVPVTNGVTGNGSPASPYVVTVQWSFTPSPWQPVTATQTELTWGTGVPSQGCSHGELPLWEVNNLRADPSNLLAVCDGQTDILVPDYWDTGFQYYWGKYIQDLATYFGVDCTQNPNPALCTAAPSYKPSDIAYVRPGAGLGGEGQPYLEGIDSKGNMQVQSAVWQQVQYWAQPQPSGSPCASGVDQSTFAGKWDAWQRCMLATYQSDFNYPGGAVPVMYPISDLDSLSSGTYVSEDVAYWALQSGIGLGQDGLNPSWAFDSALNDDPPNPYQPYPKIMWDIFYAEYYGGDPSPPAFELQTVGAATQDCHGWGSGPGTPYGDDLACTQYSKVQPTAGVSTASWQPGLNIATVTTAAPNGFTTGDSVTISGTDGYDGTYTVQVTSPTQFTYTLPQSPSGFTPGGYAMDNLAQPPYQTCAGTVVTENTYLAQLYSYVTTLETYYNDLDDTNSTVQGAYSAWKSHTLLTDQTSYFGNAQHDGICPQYG